MTNRNRSTRLASILPNFRPLEFTFVYTPMQPVHHMFDAWLERLKASHANLVFDASTITKPKYNVVDYQPRINHETVNETDQEYKSRMLGQLKLDGRITDMKILWPANVPIGIDPNL